MQYHKWGGREEELKLKGEGGLKAAVGKIEGEAKAAVGKAKDVIGK